MPATRVTTPGAGETSPRRHFTSPRRHFLSPRRHFLSPGRHLISPRRHFISPRPRAANLTRGVAAPPAGETVRPRREAATGRQTATPLPGMAKNPVRAVMPGLGEASPSRGGRKWLPPAGEASP